VKAPFPYFGGKAAIADLVWSRLGDTPNYVEPFFGSGAVLLARPDDHCWWDRIETVNDKDGLVANFWRAVKHDPEAVAHWADWPVNENDLHARHAWLVSRKDSLQERLEGDPDYFDAKIAGWWVWGICIWIGSGWCSGEGPWKVVNGRLVKSDTDEGRGIHRQLPHLGNAGRGINRKLPHLGDAGRGINRKFLRVGHGQCAAWSQHIRNIVFRLCDRLRGVRICCGDWSRIVGPAPTYTHGVITSVFLDPPYSHAERDSDIYRMEMECADAVREWCIKNGDNPLLRIALCGYEGEHAMPDGWTAVRWTANGGYGNPGNGRGRTNKYRQVVWFSPHCLSPTNGEQFSLPLGQLPPR